MIKDVHDPYLKLEIYKAIESKPHKQMLKKDQVGQHKS